MPATQRFLNCLIAVSVLVPTVSFGDPWIASGDTLLRHDLEVLADAGIVRGPLTTWPVPWPDIARDVLDVERDANVSPIQRASLQRVQTAARRAMQSGLTGHARVGGSNHPDALRGFASTPREDAELEAGVDWMGEHVALRLQATAVVDADDDKTFRADGSYVAVTFWNAVLSAGSHERWWGPGWDGSLILSTSARPVPAITLERNYSDAFEFPILELLGPWRAGIFFGQLEDERTDFDKTRLFGARVAFKPWRHLEIGLSRTAMWCGEGRPCGADAFWDLLTGNDNQSEALPIEEEPGNQLAGYDLRLSSPWQSVPLALYGQLIGEDEAGGLPSKFLGLGGIELAGAIGGGGYRATLEYSDTTCSFSHSEPEFNCAYENSIYTAGYRYRGRSIGHATDNDTRMLVFGALYARADGTSWELKVRDAELNRDALSEQVNHTQATLATDLQSVDLRHQRELFGGRLTAGVGVERREVVPTGEANDEWRVIAEWMGYVGQ